ncbi:MAG: AMP-binding protein [Chthoniobacterales bacterium]|nr:AMP-binding protein [Chthoniobacterales bacterium]
MPRGKDLLSDDVRSWEGRGSMLLLNPRTPSGRRAEILAADFPDLPDHIWLATSGTGGTLKIVALSRTALEANARAVNAHLGALSGDVWINPLPLFHVGGLGIVVRSALSGAKWQQFGPWDPEEFVRSASSRHATLSSLVPAQVHDLVQRQQRAPASLRAVVVGGGALDESLRAKAASLGWPVLPSYGLTEAASQVATADPGTADFEWLPLLPHVQARVSEGGLLELRGPSLLTGWMVFDDCGATRWKDPKNEGWFRTSDRVDLRGRQLKMLGRADDLLKIRGELVDISALERALQARVAGGAVCVQADPDERNGFTLRLVAENAVAVGQARAATDIFPPFACPVSVQIGEIPRTASGKILRVR